jgi:hypothetical protein
VSRRGLRRLPLGHQGRPDYGFDFDKPLALIRAPAFYLIFEISYFIAGFESHAVGSQCRTRTIM